LFALFGFASDPADFQNFAVSLIRAHPHDAAFPDMTIEHLIAYAAYFRTRHRLRIMTDGQVLLFF